MRTFEEILQIVCTHLNQNNVEYVIVGGIAVMYYGVPRTTVDIDFLVQMDAPQIQEFVDFLQTKDFDLTVEAMTDAFEEGSHCSVFDNRGLIRLDIQGILSDFDRSTLDRAEEIRHLGTGMRLATAEDTIVNKILFQGEQDLRDALGIYARHSEDLDFEYIERTCVLLGIMEKWNSFHENASRNLRDSSVSR
ncbi:MAG: nucleotidyltransferase [Candidatus Thorarchaeota archaeon]